MLTMVNASLKVIDRGRIRCDPNRLIEGHTVSTAGNPNPEIVQVEIPVINLVIDHPEGTFLWDTGTHPDAAAGRWPSDLYEVYTPYDAEDHRLDDDLREVGYDVDDIDYVFVTDLHADSAGGLEHFAGTDTPVFVYEKELKHAYYSAQTDKGSDMYVVDDFNHDFNWQVLHGVRENHFQDMEFLHLAGHTPGTMGGIVHLNGETVVYAGDHLPVTENYETETPPGAGMLWNYRHWFESLKRIQDIERRRDATVIFGHDHDFFESLPDSLEVVR